jgi:hypothetical protein
VSQRTQIIRHVAELSQHRRIAEITSGWIASLLSTETLPYRFCVFVDRLIGKADEDRNSDNQ